LDQAILAFDTRNVKQAIGTYDKKIEDLNKKAYV
jgi:hypothetical protein